MLIAQRNFSIGEQICVYGGVMVRMPEAQMRLNESDYITSVCSSASGSYGFELDDCEASNGMVFKKVQHVLPSLTPLINGRSIPNPGPPSDLSEIHDINGIGAECTQKLLTALVDPSRQDIVRRLLKRLKNYPEKNWKQNAIADIRRTLNEDKSSLALQQMYAVKAESPEEKITDIKNPYDNEYVEDKENQQTNLEDWFKALEHKPPKRQRIKPFNTGLDGAYWRNSDGSSYSSDREEREVPEMVASTANIDVGNPITKEWLN
jgi:hypothetical protein